MTIIYSAAKHLLAVIVLCAVLFGTVLSFGQKPAFKVIAYYSTGLEADHVQFANDAIKFYTALAAKDGFKFSSTSDWNNLNEAYLKNYQLVLWLDDSPHKKEQQLAFQAYMSAGGPGWAFILEGITIQLPIGRGLSISWAELYSTEITGLHCLPRCE